MTKHYSFAAVFAALIFCGNVMMAQGDGIGLASGAGAGGGATGGGGWGGLVRMQWRGLDLKQFFGTWNTATGTGALTACTSCWENVADGYTALTVCTSCYENTGIGYSTLSRLVTGQGNTAVGWAALCNLTGASNYNTALGSSAGGATTGGSNTAVGYAAGGSQTGSNNSAFGANAMAAGRGESNSTMLGTNAGFWSNSPDGYNAILGYQAMYGAEGVGGGGSISTGGYNVVAGAQAMYSNTTGADNVSAGYQSLYENTSGASNVASGAFSAYSNTTGAVLVADGLGALYENTTGQYNTAAGAEALFNNTTGSYNTALGFLAGTTTGTLTNSLALGYNASVSSSNTVMVGNSSVTTIGGYANWTNFSDGRYKKNIQPNVPGLSFIRKLTPVTYTLDVAGIESKVHPGRPTMPGVARAGGGGGGGGTPSSDDAVMKQAMQDKATVVYTGFVAQDVEKAADSVGFTFSGVDRPKDVNASFYGLRYGDFVPPLVKAVQELAASSDSKDSTINALQSSFDSLKMQVAELRAMLLAQKASASAAALDQNIPNPFNGSTVIGYSLPKGVSAAQMQITDVTGKVLALIPLSTTFGKNTLTANLPGDASGTYSYSLIVDGKMAGTKRMVSVR